MDDEQRIADLKADARYARERFDLYRAKVYGPRATSMTRLRELQRVSEAAEGRLHNAEQELAPGADTSPPAPPAAA